MVEHQAGNRFKTTKVAQQLCFDTGRFTLQLKTINQADVVAQVVSLQTQVAEKHFIMLESIARISQVFTTLIVNAIHHATPLGKITVHLLAMPAQSQEQVAFAQVSITAMKIGISSKDLPHIIQRLHRVDSMGQGSELGLSIAQEVVRAHSGEIIADSNIGRGSTFTVRLPIVTV